jgi:hypothetical protein
MYIWNEASEDQFENRLLRSRQAVSLDYYMTETEDPYKWLDDKLAEYIAQKQSLLANAEYNESNLFNESGKGEL